ncbi:MAG TPA: hypothetical protein VIK66_17095 [Gaiellaceae bacterium]
MSVSWRPSPAAAAARTTAGSPRPPRGSAPSCGGGERLVYGRRRHPVVAFRRPGRDRIARFGLVNVNGVETVFAVRGIS